MSERRAPCSGGVLLLVSIDTEEDNWHRSRHDVTLENIGELRQLAAFFKRLGVRPTYFTTYQVAADSRAAFPSRERARISARSYRASSTSFGLAIRIARPCMPRESDPC